MIIKPNLQPPELLAPSERYRSGHKSAAFSVSIHIDVGVLGRIVPIYSRPPLNSLIQTYDYACSFREEFEFLLQSRWTKVKALYIITRYLPFFLIIMYLCLNFTPNENPDKCRILINIYSSFSQISINCSECFFVLRTYALWYNNRIVLIGMLSTAFAIIVTSIGIRFTSIATSYVTTSAIPGVPGCSWSSSSVLYFMSFIFLFLFQLGLVSLTLIRVIQSWRSAKGHLHAVLMKHNIFYYTCGLFLSAANVLMPVLFPDSAYYTVLEESVSLRSSLRACTSISGISTGTKKNLTQVEEPSLEGISNYDNEDGSEEDSLQKHISILTRWPSGHNARASREREVMESLSEDPLDNSLYNRPTRVNCVARICVSSNLAVNNDLQLAFGQKANKPRPASLTPNILGPTSRPKVIVNPSDEEPITATTMFRVAGKGQPLRAKERAINLSFVRHGSSAVAYSVVSQRAARKGDIGAV
ncbi:hypothetical protein EDB19DRAFT_2025354 [Suillus lakei]|nr:hypothetical protein EDB19DRAFT_2025354 [Suillus lakei]